MYNSNTEYLKTLAAKKNEGDSTQQGAIAPRSKPTYSVKYSMSPQAKLFYSMKIL